MVEQQPSKLMTRVRFPSPAPILSTFDPEILHRFRTSVGNAGQRAASPVARRLPITQIPFSTSVEQHPDCRAKASGAQWKEELETKFDIPAEVAIGRDLLTLSQPAGVGAVITTYHSARQYIERLPRDRFQMLILDEAHKLTGQEHPSTHPRSSDR